MIKYSLLFTICLTQIFAGLIHPPNGSKLSYTHVLFKWEAIENVSEYEFELSNVDDFSSRLISSKVSDLQYLVKDQITWGNTYYWRVKVVDDNRWMNTYSFSTGASLSNVEIIIHDSTQYAQGNTIFGSADGYYSAVIDMYGNEIWNSGSENIIYYNLLDGGQFFGARYSSNSTYNYIGIEFSLTDGIIWEEPNNEFVHHEFIELPWGDYMGIAHEYQNGPVYPNLFDEEYSDFGCPPDGVTPCWPWQGDRLVIWDKTTKEIQWTWSTFDHFNMIDFDNNQWNQSPDFGGHFDWTHVNAFYFDDTDNTIYISTRNLSRITKLQYPSGEIIWNMGRESASGDVTFGHNLDFSYQHSISLTDADNIIILDNGNYAQEFWGASVPTTRALEIAVSSSAENYSGSIIFEYILPNYLFSSTSGNVQKLQNGNYLITTIGNSGTTLEVTSSDVLVWEANYNSVAIWRASRIPHCSDLGDVNDDETWNVLDIVTLANCVLAQNCDEQDNACAGDVNGDETWNVLDIVTLANCVLAQNCDELFNS